MKTPVLALSGLLFTAATSSALSLSFSSSTGIQPSNVGIITLTQVNPNTVNVLVDLSDTALPAPQYGFINTGGPHTPFAFQIAGTETGVSATFIQPASGVFSFGLLSLNLGGGSNTPYGAYGIAIDSSGGNGSSNAYYGDLEFNLTRLTGLSVNDFVANADNYYFSADLTNGANTGAQAWTGPGTPREGPPGAPEGGSTVVLMGTALAGLGIFFRRFSKK